MADAKAVLYESLCLSPRSEMEVMVKVKSNTISAEVCLIEAASSGVARPSWFPGLITRAECPGLQGALTIQYRSGALLCSF